MDRDDIPFFKIYFFGTRFFRIHFYKSPLLYRCRMLLVINVTIFHPIFSCYEITNYYYYNKEHMLSKNLYNNIPLLTYLSDFIII